MNKVPMRVRLATVTALLTACSPQVVQHSGRNPDLFDKESDRFQGYGRQAAPETAAPELFVRRKAVEVQRIDAPNESGSLFNPDDARNHLYASAAPHAVGNVLTISMAASRGEKKRADAAKTPEAQASKDAEIDKLEQELLKALPELAPATAGDPTLVREFKMKIMHRYDNGDVLAMTTRRSTVDGRGKELTLQARVPYDRLATGEELTTADLADVRYVETGEGELAERRSSGWEDEYSLRLSGFAEERSKAAQELEGRERQLDEARTKLETQIKTFGEERKQVAKQREELAKKEAESQEKVTQLESTVKEQQGKIEEQDQQIKDLAPEEKPGDKKDGA